MRLHKLSLVSIQTGLLISLFFVFNQVQAQTEPPLKYAFKVPGGQELNPLKCVPLKKPKLITKLHLPKITKPNSGTIPAGEEGDSAFIDEDQADETLMKPPSEEELKRYLANPGLLKNFHEAIRRAIDSRNIARVGLWGGSHMAAEFFPAELRNALQDRYGIAGPGHINLLNGRAGIRIPDATLCRQGGWRESLAPRGSGSPTLTTGLGLYLLTATSSRSSLELALKDQKNGTRPTKITLHYLRQPDGGSFELMADGQSLAVIETSGSQGLGVIEITGDKPLSTLKVITRESLPVSLIGLYAESSRGVILDNFGIAGASGNYWNTVNADFLKLASEQRPYDVVVLAYGTNDVTGKDWDPEAYRQKFAQTLGSMRKVFPKAACLLIPPGDRVGRAGGRVPVKNKKGKTVMVYKSRLDFKTYPERHALATDIQRELGMKNQCLVWNMSLAMRQMGGAYGMLKMEPPLMAKDLIHLTPKGYADMAAKLNNFLELSR